MKKFQLATDILGKSFDRGQLRLGRTQLIVMF